MKDSRTKLPHKTIQLQLTQLGSLYCLGITSPSETSCSWNWASNPESRNDQSGNDYPGVIADRSLCSSETFQASAGITGCLENLAQVTKEVGVIRFQLFQEQTPRVTIGVCLNSTRINGCPAQYLCSVLVQGWNNSAPAQYSTCLSVGKGKLALIVTWHAGLTPCFLLFAQN